MNKETLQSYNTRLSNNNASLDNILENANDLITIEGTLDITENGTYDVKQYAEATVNIESSGGGTTKATNMAEVQQAVLDLENNFIQYCWDYTNTYPTYTTEAVTLYTPNESNKRYVIRKRDTNQYQVVWFPDTILKYASWSTINTIYFRMPQTKIDGMSVTVDSSLGLFTTTSVDVYLSDTFTTTEECIQAMQDSTTTYSSANNLLFGSYMEGEYLVPYTNLPCCDENLVLIQSQRISSNETIEVIS